MRGSVARWLLVSLVALGGIGLARGSRAAEPLVTKTIEHGGRTRTYHVHVPRGYDPAKPTALVLALHGGGGRGSELDAATNRQLSQEADRRGWLVVFPEGVARGWNDEREAVAAIRRDVDDVAFLGAVIDEVSSSYAVDPTRVYATGISNGGFMSILLGLRLSDRIAAVAPVTANLPEIHQHEEPGKPMPILFMNGTEDPLVPYGGGQVVVLGDERGAILSTDDSAKVFAAHNGCTGQAPDVTLKNRAPFDRTRVIVQKGEGCAAPVVVYRIEGGGHTWPGGKQYLPKAIIGRVSRDIDGTREIFDFFADHTRS